MKKTKLMRAALLLLVLTLITSCFVGGTFAKYVTKGDSTDTARVAKWGVTVEATGKTFAHEYTKDDQNAAPGMSKSVVSRTDDMVVAPGTSGSMATVKLSGTPEVAVSVNYTADFKVKGWTVKDGDNETFYCPLEITVGKTTIKGAAYPNDQTGFEKAVNDAIAGCSKNYVANTTLADKEADDSLAVSWKWEFNGDDVKDTALGDLAAKDKAPTVTLAITTTVTQID